MRTHSHEVVRRVLEAIDTADGTGILDLKIEPSVLQEHLDLLYMSGLAIATEDPPFTELTEAGMELLIHTRDRTRWQRSCHRCPFGDGATVMSALLLDLRRSRAKAGANAESDSQQDASDQ